MFKSFWILIRQLVKKANIPTLEIILNKKAWKQEFQQESMNEN